MLKNRPVVGGVVTIVDAAASLTNPLVELTELRATNGFCRTVPLRLSLTGCSMLGSVRTCMSKPLKAGEFCTFTATVSCVPVVPWKLEGLVGQLNEEPGAMQTNPGVGGGGGEVTLTDTIVECDIEPLEPVTVALYIPVGVEDVVVTVRVELLEPPGGTRTAVGDTKTIGPPGNTVAFSFTVPVNPLRLVIVIVEAALPPWTTAKLEGFAEIEKSGLGGTTTWKVAITE